MNTNELSSQAEKLITDITQAANSEQYKNYLSFCARFHNYSLGNVMLILWQKKDASHVAGYTSWLKMKRYVKKGEHGLQILAPCPYPDKKDPDKTKVFFKPVYVFDVSQTDGEPLPEPLEWKSAEQNPQLQSKLIDFARSQGINVITDVDLGSSQGRSKGGTIELAPTAGTGTLIHEIAHEMIHHNDNPTPREIKEQQAESIAFLVMAHFKLDTSAAANYITCWKGDAKTIKESLHIIQSTAAKIINAIEPKPTPTESE